MSADQQHGKAVKEQAGEVHSIDERRFEYTQNTQVTQNHKAYALAARSGQVHEYSVRQQHSDRERRSSRMKVNVRRSRNQLGLKVELACSAVRERHCTEKTREVIDDPPLTIEIMEDSNDTLYLPHLSHATLILEE